VTSDKGLRERLNEKKCMEVMKTKNWFKIVKTLIGNEAYEQLTAVENEFSESKSEETKE